MLYEIHMLKNYPPTNLNRDESGAPKTCVFNNATRGRISSQCLKRSWRRSDFFKNEIAENITGTRTRGLPGEICERLKACGVEEEKLKALKDQIPALLKLTKKIDDKTGEIITEEIVFYSDADMDAIVKEMTKLLAKCKTIADIEGLAEDKKDKKDKEKKGKGQMNAAVKELQEALKEARPITLDIALFGRMVTSEAFQDVDASMQVAHAISTNKVVKESDFYAAMDDLLKTGGAANLGDVDYNASCYYVYASVDTDKLRKNLELADNADEIVRKAIPALLRAMAFTDPSGKQNSFAGHVLPSVVMVECKEKKIPTSMVNAFVEPVGKGGDLVKRSAEKLADEVDMTARNFGLEVRERLWFCVDKYDVKPETATKVCATFPDLVEAVASSL